MKVNRVADSNLSVDKTDGDAFRWDAPFLLEDQLSDDERMVHDSACSYAQEKLLPRLIEAYRNEKADTTIFSEMSELRVIGQTLPEEYGCANASYRAQGLVALEVERADTLYRSMMSVQSSLVMHPVDAYGTHDGNFAHEWVSLIKRNKRGRARDMHRGNGISDAFHVMLTRRNSKRSTPTKAGTIFTR